MNCKIIAVDFDGTLAEHQYPDIGPEVPGAFAWLRKFREAGANLILWTMRDNGDRGQTLDEAIGRCRTRGIEFWGSIATPNSTHGRFRRKRMRRSISMTPLSAVRSGNLRALAVARWSIGISSGRPSYA
jgi:hypothetical protein